METVFYLLFKTLSRTFHFELQHVQSECVFEICNQFLMKVE